MFIYWVTVKDVGLDNALGTIAVRVQLVGVLIFPPYGFWGSGGQAWQQVFYTLNHPIGPRN